MHLEVRLPLPTPQLTESSPPPLVVQQVAQEAPVRLLVLRQAVQVATAELAAAVAQVASVAKAAWVEQAMNMEAAVAVLAVTTIMVA